MKKYVKWLQSAVCSLLSLTVITAVACTQNTPLEMPEEDVLKTEGYEGTIEEVTGEYFVKDGKTDYKIVIPSEPSQEEEVAASELAYFFNQATNLSLEIEEDGEPYAAEACIFAIGKTTVMQNRGVSVDKDELNSEGFIIKSVGNNIIFCGGGEFGTLWSVYMFLTYAFHYDCLSADEILLDKNVTELVKSNFDIKSIPSINERFASTPHTNVDITTAHRMRFTNRETESFIQLGSIHDSFKVLPPEVYNDATKTETYHPEWYMSTGEQLCYSARGDEEKLNLMVQTAFENIKIYIEENPRKNNFMFGQEDKNVWCSCETCMASRETYNTDAAVVIKFMNKLSILVNDWLETVSPGREVVMYFFAYHKTTDAPVKMVDGMYQPIDDSVRCGKNVGVYYAPISAKYTQDFDHSLNATYKELLMKWNVLTENITLYLYQTNFRYYLVPYNTFNSMQPIYDFCASTGCKGLYDQGQMDNQVCTGFTYLREYLASKILWDSNCDVEHYTDKFFENFYRTANVPMRTYYDELRSLFVYNENFKNMGGGIYDVILKEDFWPRNTLLRWMDYIDQAYKAIEIYEAANPVLYATLQRRICIESIAIRYMYIELYCTDDTPDNYQMKVDFKNDALQCNILKSSEGVEINGLFQGWGV